MILNKFDSGLSTRIDPTLIKFDEAVEFSNIDNTSVALTNAKDILATVDAADDYFYRFNDSWVSSDNYRDYLEYKGVLYYTDAVDGPRKFDGVTNSRIGIERPPALPATDGMGDPILDFEGEQVIGIVLTEAGLDPSDFGSPQFLEVGGGTEFPADTYSYRISLTESGVESTFIVDGITTAVDNQSITIRFNATSTTPNIKLYRQYNGEWRLVGSITLSDLNAKTISDTTLDISNNELFVSPISNLSVFQYTMTYYNSNDDIESAPMDPTKETPLDTTKKVELSKLPVSTDPQVNKKRIYRIGGNLTEFSLIAEIDNIDTTYEDLVADVVEGKILDSTTNFEMPFNAQYIVEAYEIVFAAVGSELIFSDIGQPNYWPTENSISFPKDITGILPCSAGILVFTIGRAWLISGTTPAQFTRLDVDGNQGCIAHRSCQTIKGIPYWLSRDGLCVYRAGITEVISKSRIGKTTVDIKQTALYDEQYHILRTNGTMLVFDFRFGDAIKEYTFSSAVGGIGAFDNILYGTANDVIVKMFEGNDLELDYLSPVLTSGDFSDFKAFDQSYMHSDGDFEVTLFIDGVERLKTNVTGRQIHQISPPAEYQRGASLQYRFKGIGTVWSVEHKGVGRKNGR